MREFPILLASTSPRRRALLEEAGLPFALVTPGFETEGGSGEAGDPRSFAIARAREKALGASTQERAVLLAVDTVVALEDRVFGKPRDIDEARATLNLLGGREHQVWTAHSFRDLLQGSDADGDAVETHVSVSTVAIRELPEAELQAYLDRGDWRDKAGGYGIQSDAASFATLTSGRFDTVVGLDVSVVRAVYEELCSRARFASPGDAS